MVTLQRRQNRTRSLPVLEDDTEDIRKEIQNMQLKSEMKRIEDLDCWKQWKYVAWICFGCGFIPYSTFLPQNNQNNNNEWLVNDGWLNIVFIVVALLIHSERFRRIEQLKDQKIKEIGTETYNKIKYVAYGLVIVSFLIDRQYSLLISVTGVIICLFSDVKSGRMNAGFWVKTFFSLMCVVTVIFIVNSFMAENES